MLGARAHESRLQQLTEASAFDPATSPETSRLELLLTEFSSPEGSGLTIVSSWARTTAVKAAYRWSDWTLSPPAIEDGKVTWVVTTTPRATSTSEAAR